MNKYFRYIFATILLLGSIGFLYGVSTESGSFLLFGEEQSYAIPDDSVTPFPVKKTQITRVEDLKSRTPIDLKDPSNVETVIEYDVNTKYYIYKTKIGDKVVSTPFSLSADEYWDHTLKESMSTYFKNKNALTEDGELKDDGFSLKDIHVDLGVADRIFGPGGLKVQTNGYVEVSMGMKSTSIDNPTLSQRNRNKTAFQFNEEIQMNVNATVGERMGFGMNYDTKSMFDFDSKRIKLEYEGGEDEIVKRIAAGNVSMATTNSLINGGNALFGINAELQFGKLRVNTIVSQQESQSQTVNAKGGVQTNTFEFKADAYDENRHFFLAHYFRDNYDKAMSKLPFVQSPVLITEIEVWISNKRTDFTQARNMVAFADLAETDSIRNPLWKGSSSNKYPDNNSNRLHSEMTTTHKRARDISQTTSVLGGIPISSGLDYEKVESGRLLNTSEYTYNAQLGYISLTSALQADEVLAVAYSYKVGNETYQVGEMAAQIVDKYQDGNDRSGALFLKMLKPVSMSPRAYTWNLMMKNVYSIGANGIQKDKFRFNIAYQSDSLGTALNYLPEGGEEVKGKMLLRVMGLDRLDSNQKANADGMFDFMDGYTIRSENGRIFFPVVEPFGKHLRNLIKDPILAQKYVYDELYTQTKTAAQQIAEKNKYKMSGSYRGSVSDADIDLNATNVPQGSVRVTANGVKLTEGVDYIVDYISGRVTVINQNLIDADTPIQVSLEDRTFSMQRKTLLGLNLSYDISKTFNVGGTIMHMYEKPLTTKTEIGNESVKNTLWGLNTSYKTEAQWLTNLIDKLPFVNATQPSHISLNAEFAQLIAGHYENKEAGGYSYLDDFETSQSIIDIKSPYAWFLSSVPKGFPGYNANIGETRYGFERSLLSWFMIDPLFTRKNSNITPRHITKEDQSNHFVREIMLDEIYPEKDVNITESATLPVLNLSYYPQQRGPYNLNVNVDTDGNFPNPKDQWGGITRKMDVRDFESSNIEYIEFWLMDPFVYNSKTSTPNEGGKLVFNLGEISEDVLKDGKKFYENGLPVDGDPTATETTIWGKVPTRQSTVYAFNDQAGTNAREVQDVGLNGLSTEEERGFHTYTDYMRDLRKNLLPATIDQFEADDFSPLRDPSGDNYHHFRGSDYDQREVSIMNRYKYYNGTEGNSPTADGGNESYSTAARSVPDVEDIDQDNTLNETDSYYEYEVELDPKMMEVGKNDFIVNTRRKPVTLRDGTKDTITWYQFKIPVRSDKRKIVGTGAPDFKSIRFMRMYLTDFAQETFLRFGTLQLVRGDWRVYEQTLNKNEEPSGTGSIDLSTVNIEENGDKAPVNYILPPGLKRSLDPDQTQLTKENEQSLSMKIVDLASGDARAIYKNTSYDLRRYKRLQLFTHAEELADGTPLSRGELTVFIRLGSDYKNNYYEYEIPLSITPAGRYSQVSDQEVVWPTDNMFNFSLDVLKNLKLERNRKKRVEDSKITYSTVYTGYDPDHKANKISVKGNPSLSEVNVIMVGIRNDSRISKSGEVWINELRLTDFDEEGGWAAQGNVSVALSDIGTVNFSGRRETSGFGGIDQSLMERRSDDYSMYSISTNLDLGRFIPEKAKLSIPFYYSYSNETTTPKYDPYDQDVTLKESLKIVETKAERDSIKSLAQEKTTVRGIGFNNIKLDIKSKTPMPYDPANFTLGYTFNQTEFKSPTMAYDVAKNYRALMSYAYNPLMKTWEPFKNKKSNSATTKYLKSLGLNYLPSNIAFNSEITRNYTETLVRDVENLSVENSSSANSNTFLSWSQAFYWQRSFNLNWDLTRNLKLSFQSGTKAEIEEPYLQVNKKANRDHYEEWKDSVWRSIRSLGNPLEYRQTAKATYQLPFRSISALDWITSTANYTSGYQWERGAKLEGDFELGNTISNNITLDIGNRFNMVSLYNKSGFLKKVNERFAPRRAQGVDRQQGRPQQQKETVNRRYTQTIRLKEKEKTIIKHNLATKDIEIIAKHDGRPYKLKFKKVDDNSIEISNKDTANIEVNVLRKLKNPSSGVWKDIAEYSARGLMSIRTVSLNYSQRRETYISGYNQHIGNAFGQSNSEYGLAPGLGFAFGFESGDDFLNKSLDREWLIKQTENISPAVYNKAVKLDARIQLEPINGMRVELNFGREKNNRTEVQYMYDNMPRTFGGSFSMTTVALSSAFGSGNAKNGYKSAAFDKFLKNRDIIQERLFKSYDGITHPNGATMTQDDIRKNSGDVLIPAFIAAYTGKNVNNISLSAFPSLSSILPNWTLSYDGLINIPALKSQFKTIRLNHAYTCLYQVGNYGSHSTWQAGRDDLGFIRDILGDMIPSSQYSIGSVGITEGFNPLFGVEGVLNNNMSLNLRYNNSRTLTLNMSSYQIIEALQNELVVGLGYRINEFNRILGIAAKKDDKFNNDLNIKADLSNKTAQALIRKIEEEFTQATSGSTIMTLKISADYTLSRALILRAFYDRILNKPLVTSVGYPTTNTSFGISLKITLLQ